MTYCVPLGIPHSEFLSWDPDDQDKALAYTRAKAEICQGCGTRMQEWREDRFAYISNARTCPGCELIEMEQEQVREGVKGVQIFLVKNDPDNDDDEDEDF